MPSHPVRPRSPNGIGKEKMMRHPEQTGDWRAGESWWWMDLIYIYIYILYYTIWVCIYLYIGIWCWRHDIVLWSIDHQLVWNSPISNMLPSGETHAPHFELHWSIPPQPNPAKWSWGIGHGIDTLRLPAFSQESLFSTFSAWFWGIICREGVHNTGLSTATATPKQQYIYIYIYTYIYIILYIFCCMHIYIP